MTVTIYGDVLAAVNFTVTLMLLSLCGKILGVPPGRGAKYISAALGAAASFIIFIPMKSVFLQIVYRLMVSVLLVGVAFPENGRRFFWRSIGVFYAASFLAAGVVAGLVWLFPAAGFFTANGVVYLNIRPMILLGAVTAAYVMVSVYDRFAARRSTGQNLYRMTIIRNGTSVKVSALADTGNFLTEPFSGLPVIVVNASAVWPLLSEQEKDLIFHRDTETVLPRLRWVLCRTVAGNSLLPAFAPDAILITTAERTFTVGAYFAVSGTAFADDPSYSGVFNPKMLQAFM